MGVIRTDDWNLEGQGGPPAPLIHCAALPHAIYSGFLMRARLAPGRTPIGFALSYVEMVAKKAYRFPTSGEYVETGLDPPKLLFTFPSEAGPRVARGRHAPPRQTLTGKAARRGLFRQSQQQCCFDIRRKEKRDPPIRVARRAAPIRSAVAASSLLNERRRRSRACARLFWSRQHQARFEKKTTSGSKS